MHRKKEASAKLQWIILISQRNKHEYLEKQ